MRHNKTKSHSFYSITMTKKLWQKTVMKNYDEKLWQKTNFQSQIQVLFSFLILYHLHRPQKFKNGVIFALGPTVLLIKPVFRFWYQNALICISKWSGWSSKFKKAILDRFWSDFGPILDQFWPILAYYGPFLAVFRQFWPIIVIYWSYLKQLTSESKK